MERLGKSEILLSHSSSPLVSPFIIFPFLPVPPSTADIPIPKDVTRCHPAARAWAWRRLCQPRAGLLPLRWLMSPEAGAKPACSAAPPPPAACSGASDIKPHPVAVRLLEVRAVCPSSMELQNSTKLITQVGPAERGQAGTAVPSEQDITPPALPALLLSSLPRHRATKHREISQEGTYHRVEEPNAALELGSSFTELPKEKPSDRLLFAYAAVISL